MCEECKNDGQEIYCISFVSLENHAKTKNVPVRGTKMAEKPSKMTNFPF